MDRISAPAIASMLLTAPAWARVGLAVRSERIRQEAAKTIADVIIEGFGEALATERLESATDRDQLALPL